MVEGEEILNAKAIDIAKNKIMAWCESETKKNDIILQNAIADDNEELINYAVSRRDWLRDKPQDCDDKSLDELKTIIENLKL